MTPTRAPLATTGEACPDEVARLLAQLEQVVDHLPPEAGPALIGNLERIKAKLWNRMMEATRTVIAPPPGPSTDQLLSAEEAADMLGVKLRWLRDHAHDIPARVELPGRVTRFSRRKLEKWIEQRLP